MKHNQIKNFSTKKLEYAIWKHLCKNNNGKFWIYFYQNLTKSINRDLDFLLEKELYET